MEKYTKRLLSLALVAVMVFSMLPDFSFAASAQTETQSQAQTDISSLPQDAQSAINEAAQVKTKAAAIDFSTGNVHVCPVCGGEAVEWAPLTARSGLSKGKHYYLDADITDNTATDYVFQAAWTSGVDNNEGKICLHLNNHNITSSTTSAIRMITYGGTLNIMAGGNPEKNVVIGNSSTTGSSYWTGGAIHVNNTAATVNVYGGTYKKYVETADVDYGEPVVFISEQGGTINVYNDTVIDGRDLEFRTDAYAAVVSLRPTKEDTKLATFNMYGGTIYGSAESTRGGRAVYMVNAISGTATNAAIFNMYSGTIHGGSLPSGNVGAGVRVSAKTAFNMYGGKVTGGKNGTKSESVSVQSGGIANIQTYVDAIDAFNNGGSAYNAKCRHCGGIVKWSVLTEYRWPSGHMYIPVGGLTYTTETHSAYVAGYNTYSMSSAVSLCVNLNGTGLSTSGTGFALSNAGAKLAIMGEGTVSGAGTSEKGAAIDITAGAQVDIYGGTYTQKDTDTGSSLVRITKGTLNISGGTLTNTAENTKYMVQASGEAITVTIGQDAVLNAKNNKAFNCWTSTEKVNLSGKITGLVLMQAVSCELFGKPQINQIQLANAADATKMTGGSVAVDKVGVFTTAFETPEAAAAAAEYFSIYGGSDTKVVYANKDNKLEIGVPPVEVVPGVKGDYDDGLDFGTDGLAWCPVCEDYFEWIPITDAEVDASTNGYVLGNGGLAADAHKHYYLTGNLTSNGKNCVRTTWNALGTMCLHLDGFNMTSETAHATVYNAYDGTVNIMGSGVITGGTGPALQVEDTNKAAQGAAYAGMGGINVYSGKLTKASTNTTTPIIKLAASGGNFNVYGGQIGEENATLTGGSAAVEIDGKNDVATFRLYGGTIYGVEGGTATVAFVNNDNALFEMHGGSIVSNNPNKHMIVVNLGTVDIKSDAVLDATNAKYAINVWGTATGKATVSGTVLGTVYSSSTVDGSITLSGTPSITKLHAASCKVDATAMTGLKTGSAKILLTASGSKVTFKDADTATAALEWFAYDGTDRILSVSDNILVTVTASTPGAVTTVTQNLDFGTNTNGKAYCPVCKGDHKTWTAVTNGMDISAAGHYYLNSDDITNVTVSAASGTVCLHLNGHNITNTAGKAITVSGAATVNVMGTGTISGVGTAKTTGAALHVTKGQVNLYSGNYIKSDAVAPIIYAAGGNITMAVKEGDAATGAVIGSATGLSATTAAVYLGASTFTMNNGTIYGLTASGDAGAVYLGSGANFVMNDGEVLLGSCATTRTLILAAYGSATIGEGAEVDATAAGFALNQWNAGSSVVTISGTITGKVNTSHANGGLKLVGTPTLTYLYIGTSNNTTPPTVGLIDVNGLVSGASVKVFADTPVFTTAITGDIDVILSGLTPYKTGYEVVKEGNTIAVQIPKGQIDGKLILVDNRGWCWHCNEYVTWTTPATGTNKYQMTTATHYYLKDGVTYNRIDTGWYSNIDYSKASQYCLHLNGNNIINDAGSAILMSRSYGATLSIMGGGIVSGVASGSYPGYCGAAIQMNHHLGVINLYSGTYTKPVTDEEAPIIFVQDGGGTINMYEKAVIDASGRTASKLSPAVALYGGGQALTVTSVTPNFVDDNEGYAAGANPNRPAVFNMYGGIIKTGVVTKSYGAGIALIKTYSQFNMFGGKINEEDTTKTEVVLVLEKGQADIQANAKVYGTVTQWSDAATRLSISGTVNRVSASNKTNGIVLSGTPTIGELSLASGVLADVSSLTGGNIAVTASSAFTAPLEPAKAEALKDIFQTTSDAYKIELSIANELTIVFSVNVTDNLDGKWTNEETHEAYCAVCKEKVLWTAWNGGEITEGGHYYLADTLTAATTINTTAKVCLHLNGKDITTSETAITINQNVVLNILGVGIVTGTSTSQSAGAALNDTKTATVNLYSGTFKKSADSKVTANDVTKDVAILKANGGTLNLIGCRVEDTYSVANDATDYALVFNTSGQILVDAGAVIQAATYDCRAINTWTGETNPVIVRGKVDGLVMAQRGITLEGEPVLTNLRVYVEQTVGQTTYHPVNDFNGMVGGSVTIYRTDITQFSTEITNNAATIASYFHHADSEYYIGVNDANKLEIFKGSIVVIIGGEATAMSPADALGAANNNPNAVIKLLGEGITLTLNNHNVVVDMNGFNGTVNGTGTVYGVDKSTDKFGKAIAGILTVEGDSVRVEQDVTSGGNRYLYIMHGEGNYSFHRVIIKLTQIVLNTKNSAIYYKAQFQSDETLANRVDNFGINYSLEKMPSATAPLASQIPVPMDGKFTGNNNASTSYICDIVTEGNDQNSANAEGKIYANPYIYLNVDGNGNIVGFDQYAPETESAKSLSDLLAYYDNAARYEALKNQIFTDTEGKSTNKAEELDKFCATMGLEGYMVDGEFTEFAYIGTTYVAPAATEDEEEEA